MQRKPRDAPDIYGLPLLNVNCNLQKLESQFSRLSVRK